MKRKKSQAQNRDAFNVATFNPYYVEHAYLEQQLYDVERKLSTQTMDIANFDYLEDHSPIYSYPFFYVFLACPFYSYYSLRRYLQHCNWAHFRPDAHGYVLRRVVETGFVPWRRVRSFSAFLAAIPYYPRCFIDRTMFQREQCAKMAKLFGVPRLERIRLCLQHLNQIPASLWLPDRLLPWYPDRERIQGRMSDWLEPKNRRSLLSRDHYRSLLSELDVSCRTLPKSVSML